MKMLRRRAIWLTLSLLAAGCQQTKVVAFDPEPPYSVVAGYPRLVSGVVKVEAGGEIGELDADGCYVVHGRHLRALIAGNAAATRPAH